MKKVRYGLLAGLMAFAATLPLAAQSPMNETIAAPDSATQSPESVSGAIGRVGRVAVAKQGHLSFRSARVLHRATLLSFWEMKQASCLGQPMAIPAFSMGEGCLPVASHAFLWLSQHTIRQSAVLERP